MGQMEQQPHNSEDLQMARNMAQIELAVQEGEDLLPWIEKHAKDFDEITRRNPDILNELAEERTHDQALEKVKQEIYH